MTAPEPGDWLWRAATGRGVLVACIVATLLIVAFAVWAAALHVKRDEQVGRPTFLSVAALTSELAEARDVVRHYMLWSTLTLDVLFPPAYSIALSLVIAALLWTVGMPNLQLLRFIPFAGAAFDYAENAFIVLWASGRMSAPAAARPLAVLTPTKWAFAALSLLIILVLGAFALLRRA